MKGVEIVADQAYFRGSTAELQRALTGGALDRCGSLVVEGKLNALPPEIGRLKRLRELILDTDTIQTIDEALFQCVGLVKLVVLSNQIKQLPAGGWARLVKLEQLDLTTSNALRELPADLGEAPRLVGDLDLSQQTKLAALPPSFARLAGVTLLRLPPGLPAPESIAGMKGLRELQLRGVDRLPDDLGELKDLRLLDAYECPITALPESIGGATLLRALALARTKLTALPDSLTELRALRDLDLAQTPLVTLPEAIGLVPLTRLRLQNTLLKRLPESLATPAGDLRMYLPREQRDVIEMTSMPVLRALGSRVVFE
jgi:Leucine-rich repeat (LRR) protein